MANRSRRSPTFGARVTADLMRLPAHPAIGRGLGGTWCPRHGERSGGERSGAERGEGGVADDEARQKRGIVVFMLYVYYRDGWAQYVQNRPVDIKAKGA